MYMLDNLQLDCNHFTGKEQINVLCKNACAWNFSVMTTLVSIWYILHTCTLDVHGLIGGDIIANFLCHILNKCSCLNQYTIC